MIRSEWYQSVSVWRRALKGWTTVNWIGFIALALGIAHYLPLPTLPIPRLIALHDDLAPELIGIGTTVFVIDQLLRTERKFQLIRQFGSKSRDVTEMAWVELDHEGWLRDGSLRQSFLTGASLSEADLYKVDLRGSNLMEADLREANLIKADLRWADLRDADLGGALLAETYLRGADLRGAYIDGAHLGEAYLNQADLRGTDLRGSYLIGARLRGADLSEADLRETRLPTDLVINPDKWKAVIIESRTLRWSRD